MKNFKRIVIAAVLAVVLCAFGMAGCKDEKAETLSGSVTVVINNNADPAVEFTASLDGFTAKNSPMDVIDKLAADGKVCYSGTNGVYGKYLTGIGIVEGEGENKRDVYLIKEDFEKRISLYMYTSVKDDQADYEGALSVEYKDTVLVESMNGISRMKLQDGAIYYITSISW